MARNLENYRKWKRAKYIENREKEITRKRLYRQTERAKLVTRAYYEKIKGTVEYLARVKVSSAIKRGKLKKGTCEICSEKKVQAHHKDYSEPLKVIWLCKKHHSECHINSNT